METVFNNTFTVSMVNRPDLLIELANVVGRKALPTWLENKSCYKNKLFMKNLLNLLQPSRYSVQFQV